MQAAKRVGNGDMQAAKRDSQMDLREMEICKQHSEDEVRHLPAIELEWAW